MPPISTRSRASCRAFDTKALGRCAQAFREVGMPQHALIEHQALQPQISSFPFNIHDHPCGLIVPFWMVETEPTTPRQIPKSACLGICFGHLPRTCGSRIQSQTIVIKNELCSKLQRQHNAINKNGNSSSCRTPGPEQTRHKEYYGGLL